MLYRFSTELPTTFLVFSTILLNIPVHVTSSFLINPFLPLFPSSTHPSRGSPALRGLGTPPTNTVLRGSRGREASRTKSASESLQGRICTGLSLMVGEETHRYSLSSSWMQASISCCTLLSSWREGRQSGSTFAFT